MLFPTSYRVGRGLFCYEDRVGAEVRVLQVPQNPSQPLLNGVRGLVSTKLWRYD